MKMSLPLRLTEVIAAALLFMPMAQGQVKPVHATKIPKQQQHVGNHRQFQSEGERIFVQNCARCHTPPDGFAPRITGTIVLHMRVRAGLSEHDARELMRYFNP